MVGGVCSFLGLAVLAAGASAGAATIPLGAATGGVAIYFNNNGGGEMANNTAYLRTQFSQTDVNGMEFNFDSTPLPGTGGSVSWNSIFQSVPNQFGLDVVTKFMTSDGTVPTPTIDSYDNVDGNTAHRSNAGPESWGIGNYTGSTVGPSDPTNVDINTLLRGGGGGSVVGGTPDGVQITALGEVVSLPNIILTFAATVTSDGFVHWYNPATPNSPLSNFEMTGKYFLSGTFTAPASQSQLDNIIFFSGTMQVDAEVICAARFTNAVTGSDTVPGPAPNTCRNSGAPCKTIQHAADVACPGDTVNVANGLYTENVVLSKAVHILGAGPGAKVIPATSNPNCSPGSLCNGSASNIILVQADDVEIEGLTLDGDNPGLTSGVVAGGADLDARNGIITNHLLGVYQNLKVHNVTVKNIYLRGIYASSGGSFNLDSNTVQNVQADPASIGIFNFAGGGTMNNNVVSSANDAISSNHSTGTQFLNNQVTGSGSGVHTDNAGDGGGTADLISGNQISACQTGGYGVFVFVPYIAPTVQDNTITGCSVGLAAFGTGNPVTSTFSGNHVDGQGVASSIGVFVTTDQVGFGANNVFATFTSNVVDNNSVGVEIDQDPGFTSTASLTCNAIRANTTGLLSASSASSAHNNAISGGPTGANGTAITSGMMSADLNWWGCANGPGSFGCGTVAGAIDFMPFSATPDPCIPPPRALNVTKARLSRSTSPTANGTVSVNGDFLAALPGEVFSAASGIGLRVTDYIGLDTTALGVPTPVWAPANCTTLSDNATHVIKKIRCRSTNRNYTGTFTALRPFNPNGNQAYKFAVKFRKLATVAPFQAPVTVEMTYGSDIDRVGIITLCAANASGLSCR
jgi:hypothetical protein